MEVCPPVCLAVRWPSARRTADFPRRLSANPTARRTEAAVPTGVRPTVRRPSAPAVPSAVCPVKTAVYAAVRPGRLLQVSPRPSAGHPLAVHRADRRADGLLPHPRTQQPPSSASSISSANSTLNGRISGEYKEGSTNTLSLLPNLCFPRALSCTLHLLLGKPLLRKSEIVLGVSFGTPNTIFAAWLLHSFIPYFCTHRNGQQTMVPLVHRNLSRSWQKK